MSQANPPAGKFITIVSGLPRTGTSLMMQMLNAGGMPVLADDARAADEDNPRGYLEFQRVKNLKADHSWLSDAVGKAVKIIHLLLPELPLDRSYRVIFMQRDLDEVVRSQSLMLQRLNRPGAAMDPQRLKAVFQTQLATVRQWLANQPSISVLPVEYAQLVREPRCQAEEIADFLGGGFDLDAMAAAVDPKLYRNRSA